MPRGIPKFGVRKAPKAHTRNIGGGRTTRIKVGKQTLPKRRVKKW